MPRGWQWLGGSCCAIPWWEAQEKKRRKKTKLNLLPGAHSSETPLSTPENRASQPNTLNTGTSRSSLPHLGQVGHVQTTCMEQSQLPKPQTQRKLLSYKDLSLRLSTPPPASQAAVYPSRQQVSLDKPSCMAADTLRTRGQRAFPQLAPSRAAVLRTISDPAPSQPGIFHSGINLQTSS